MKNKRLQIIWRYGLVSVLVTLVAILIISNVVCTTIIDADKWNAKADSVLKRVTQVLPTRGDILACDGSVLATNLTAYTIAIDYRAAAPRDTAFVAALDSLCDSLAYYYPQRDRKQWKEYLAAPLTKSRKERKQSHVLLKDASYADYLRILDFPFFRRYKKRKYAHGLHYTTREIRVMPYGQMARRSIGRCNYVSVAKYEGDTTMRQTVEALQGYSGLEAALDKLLYGQEGTARSVQLTHGVRWWVDKPAVDGLSVKTTIDINMQDIAENELQDMLNRTGADWGTCLLMEVATGDIKAISNLEKSKNGNYIEAMNYTLRAYEPGSVMKPISMVVALEDGYAFPLDKQYQIGSTYTYAGGAPIHDTHSPASLPISRFIEYSSNIGMTKLIAPHYENNLNGFRERLAELGFFDEFKTGMAGERTPYFPTLKASTGGRVSLSRMAYGYSTMIPPLYVCAFYNAIANDGKFVRPRMYKELIDRKGNVTKLPVSYVRDSICSRKNAQILREMIYGVVHGSGGTAKSLRNDIVDVVGKTGTSRIAYEAKRDSSGNIINAKTGYKENQYRLAFCGFFPYEKPKYTCMVLISNPSPEFRGAATTSGNVVKNIAIKMYARGMLDNSMELDKSKTLNSVPTLYASDKPLPKSFKQKLGTSDVKHFRRPETTRQGCTPDVMGLGLREAVAKLEDAGYNVNIRGSGFVVAQAPAAGQSIKPGATVTVTFASK